MSNGLRASVSDATHVAHHSPHRPLSKPIDPRRHQNRPPLARNALDILNARTNDAEYPAPHRFDFWQFRHRNLTTEARRTRRCF